MELDVDDTETWSWVTYGSVDIAEMEVDVFERGRLLDTIEMVPSTLPDIDWIGERGSASMRVSCMDIEVTSVYRAVTIRGHRLRKTVEPCCD